MGIILLALFLSGGAFAFSQNQMTGRNSIPEELLRPRRDEAPRYPIDTVIGELGKGQASAEAYATARRTAEALLSGNMNAPILASVNRVFLESCMSVLNTINPRYFRIGGGREEPDGSSSFLVRFAGREEGITGELYVRLEERRRSVAEQPPAQEAPSDEEPPSPEIEAETAAAELSPAESGEEEAATEAAEPAEVAEEEPPVRVWLFEDLILEEARSREAENGESRHRFDFPPYERFF